MPFTINNYQPRVGDYVTGIYRKTKSEEFYTNGYVMKLSF